MKVIALHISTIVSIAVGSILAGNTEAYALPRADYNRALAPNRAPLHMAAIRETVAPFAFSQFCAEQSDQCEAKGTDDVVALTKEKRIALQSTNVEVNRQIRYQDDRSGTDVWRIGVLSGDCDDYALTKRQRLLSAGWPSGALRIATARTEQGVGHAVLIVSTTEGDLVLDNRTNVVKPWYAAQLHWIKIQSSEDPRKWMKL